MTYATTKKFVPKLSPQEPPEDYRIFNRHLPDGTRRPVSEFFDRAATAKCKSQIVGDFIIVLQAAEKCRTERHIVSCGICASYGAEFCAYTTHHPAGDETVFLKGVTL